MGKSILFIMPYPLGEAASQRFRFEQYLELLKTHGFLVVLKSFWSVPSWRVLYKPGHLLTKAWGLFLGICNRTLILFKVPSYDFIFIHREAAPIGPPVWEWIVAKVLRKKIIYDFDDAIWLPNTSTPNSLIAGVKWHSKVKSICRWSYRISCGNEYLASFAKNHNARVTINPTTIDSENHHNPENYRKVITQKITVGWTGTHSTAQYLSTMAPILHVLEKKYPERLKFLVICDVKPAIETGIIEFLPWKKESEVEDLLKIDIGIMPLDDNAWSKGKCGFKILQYMSLGIPAVASPVGVNSEIIIHEQNGFLCTSPEMWIREIEALINSQALREKIGNAGRERVRSAYSVLSNGVNFISLFE